MGMIVYVIHKTTRLPLSVSYTGPTWDDADIRARRKDTYDDINEANEIAGLLGKHNPVGFRVSAIKQET